MKFSVLISGPTYVFRLAEQLGVLHLDYGVSPTRDGGACCHPHHLTRHHGVGGLHRHQWGNFTTEALLNQPGRAYHLWTRYNMQHVLQNAELREPAGLKPRSIMVRGEGQKAKMLNWHTLYMLCGCFCESEKAIESECQHGCRPALQLATLQ